MSDRRWRLDTETGILRPIVPWPTKVKTFFLRVIQSVHWHLVGRKRTFRRLKELGGRPPFSNRPLDCPPPEQTYRETDFRRD